jgi:hypothetical protein
LARVTYEQARKDHEYLWSIAPAEDMTGGYMDQDDLKKLLRNPTKATARECYVDQIHYWFQVGPDGTGGSRRGHGLGEGRVPWHDKKVREIAERHGIPLEEEEGSEF